MAAPESGSGRGSDAESHWLSSTQPVLSRKRRRTPCSAASCAWICACNTWNHQKTRTRTHSAPVSRGLPHAFWRVSPWPRSSWRAFRHKATSRRSDESVRPPGKCNGKVIRGVDHLEEMVKEAAQKYNLVTEKANGPCQGQEEQGEFGVGLGRRTRSSEPGTFRLGSTRRSTLVLSTWEMPLVQRYETRGGGICRGRNVNECDDLRLRGYITGVQCSCLQHERSWRHGIFVYSMQHHRDCSSKRYRTKFWLHDRFISYFNSRISTFGYYGRHCIWSWLSISRNWKKSMCCAKAVHFTRATVIRSTCKSQCAIYKRQYRVMERMPAQSPKQRTPKQRTPKQPNQKWRPWKQLHQRHYAIWKRRCIWQW